MSIFCCNLCDMYIDSDFSICHEHEGELICDDCYEELPPESGSENLAMRDWCYCQKPEVYEIYCDICSGNNTTWSEYKGLIWCYDCKKDTKGTGGIFTGPVALGACAIMGISFDRIRLSDNKLLKMKIEDGEVVYKDQYKEE